MTPEILIARDAENGAHTILAFKEGRKFIHAVALHNPPVRIVKIPSCERRYLRPLEFKGAAYPLPRALRRFREAGRTFGITKSAAIVLKAIDQERKGAA